MKIKIYIIVFLLNLSVLAQNSNDFFERTKQQYSEKMFHEKVFNNPSLMSYFGDKKHSKVKVSFQENEDEFYKIQRSNNSRIVGFSVNSFFPVDSAKTLWGKAVYQNSNAENIRWNESVDYERIYPYVTADSVGGAMKSEIYSFLGGYAKKYKKIDIGAVLNYKANLSSRNIDPRPKNISSDLNFKIGSNLKMIQGLDVGLYLQGQRYTQSNNLVFYNKIGNPAVYHLNGLGYFNSILKGSITSVNYDAYGYRTGLTLTNSKSKNLWLNVDYQVLDIDKILQSSATTVISNLTNSNFSIDLTKLFPLKKYTFGVKLNYKKNSKNGVEPILSGRNGITILVLKTNKYYNLENDILGVNFLFYMENKQKLFKIVPYATYEKYREDYLLITSFQYFDYVKGGMKLDYLYKIKNDVFEINTDINFRQTLKNQTLLRNDSEVSISEMLQHNAGFLSEDGVSGKINLEYTHQLNLNLNVFFGVGSAISVYGGNQLNNLYNLSTGITF